MTTQAAHAVELAGRVAVLSGVAQNPDGSVKITVGSNGQVQNLHLSDGACQLGGPHLARQIMSVMHAAQADLSAEVTDVVHATVGADTEIGRAVLRSFHTRLPPPRGTDHDSDMTEDHECGVSEVRDGH
jgi:hypothetical protein